jgi:hypothetical protein
MRTYVILVGGDNDRLHEKAVAAACEVIRQHNTTVHHAYVLPTSGVSIQFPTPPPRDLAGGQEKEQER